MFRTRRLKQTRIDDAEDDFVSFEHKRMTEFHPHCFLPQLALAEARLFDDTMALAHHHPVHGEDE